MVRPIRTPTIKPNAERRLQGKGPAAVLGSPRLSVTPEFDGAGRPHDVEIVEQRKGAGKAVRIVETESAAQALRRHRWRTEVKLDGITLIEERNCLAHRHVAPGGELLTSLHCSCIRRARDLLRSINALPRREQVRGPVAIDSIGLTASHIDPSSVFGYADFKFGITCSDIRSSCAHRHDPMIARCHLDPRMARAAFPASWS